MPVYEFACRSCGHEFEELVGFAAPAPACPACAADGPERLISGFAVHGVAPRADFSKIPFGGGGGCCGGACGHRH